MSLTYTILNVIVVRATRCMEAETGSVVQGSAPEGQPPNRIYVCTTTTFAHSLAYLSNSLGCCPGHLINNLRADIVRYSFPHVPSKVCTRLYGSNRKTETTTHIARQISLCLYLPVKADYLQYRMLGHKQSCLAFVCYASVSSDYSSSGNVP